MGQKGSTLSVRSQEFLVSLTKVSCQKTAISLICYQQSGEWRRENSSTCSPCYLPLFFHVTFTFFNAPLGGPMSWSYGTNFTQGDGQGEEFVANCQCPTVSTRSIPILVAVPLLPKDPGVTVSMGFARQHFPFSFLVLSCMWSLILLHLLCWPWVIPPCVLWLNDYDWIQLYAAANSAAILIAVSN